MLARRLGPLPELMAASGGGEVFATRAELDAAMARLLHDPAYRARLAQAGRQALESLWTERTVIPRYLEIVRAAAADRQGARVPSPNS